MRLRRARIEGEQQLAAPDVVAVTEVDGLDEAADASADFDLAGGLEPACEIVPVDDAFGQRYGHGDRRGGRRALGFRTLRTAIKRARHEDGHGDDLQPAQARTLPVG